MISEKLTPTRSWSWLETSKRPNTYVDDTRSKIVIESGSMFARKEKSGNQCIFLDTEEENKSLEHSTVTFLSV